MTSTQYDSSILQQFADDLYARARWIVFKTTAFYGFVALSVSVFALNLLQNQVKPPMTSDTIMIVSLVFTVIGLLAGWSTGSAKAFHFRLQAQQILCQKQIEVNTRSGGEPTMAKAAHI
jgi:hypothetical protein